MIDPPESKPTVSVTVSGVTLGRTPHIGDSVIIRTTKISKPGLSELAFVDKTLRVEEITMEADVGSQHWVVSINGYRRYRTSSQIAGWLWPEEAGTAPI